MWKGFGRLKILDGAAPQPQLVLLGVKGARAEARQADRRRGVFGPRA